ncbi:helix-turn-helix transcriptional regulator [Clostridium caseinilyticum]|uniref:helix-turn-helix transcriptional regulator n=1 Tax=Clostridium caseinilyticum TaxID=3350403 RepID=UPI0038F72932
MNSKLIAYRRMFNLNQEDVAKVINRSVSTYNRKEVGKIDFTQTEMITITEFFKERIPEITMDEIFFNNNIGRLLNLNIF